MKTFIKKCRGLVEGWLKGVEGTAAVEAAMVFPILLVMLLGTFDMGDGILANQKTIRASQVIGDLVTRDTSVTDAQITDDVEAGRLAFEPMDTSSFAYDIVSISFDSHSNPQIVWRETSGMAPSPTVLNDVEPLAEAGNGVVVVTVKYLFKPVFAGFVVNNIPMTEVSFTRGRKSAVVDKV